MAREDYIPSDEDTLSTWAGVLKVESVKTANANAMGWGSGASNVEAAAQQIEDAVAAKKASRQAWLAENAAQDTIIASAEGVIRTMVGQGKKEPTATEAIQKALGVWGTEVEFDPATYKAELRKVEATGGGVLQVKFAKASGALTGANLYIRKTGEAAWTMVAVMLRSPFVYHGTLTTPGVPESLEVRVRGFVGNDEVGLVSDAQTVLVN